MRVVHTPAVVALILCIVGATSASSPANIESQSTVRVGIILYTVVLIVLVLLTVGAWWAKRKSSEGEGRLILAVICTLPFLAVRLLYSLLAAFSKSSTFNPVTGSTTAALLMSVLEEMFVVVIYISTGLKLPAVPAGAADSPKSTLAYRLGRGDFGTGKLGILSMGAAAFRAFDQATDGGNQQKQKKHRSQDDAATGDRNHERRRKTDHGPHGNISGPEASR